MPRVDWRSINRPGLSEVLPGLAYRPRTLAASLVGNCSYLPQCCCAIISLTLLALSKFPEDHTLVAIRFENMGAYINVRGSENHQCTPKSSRYDMWCTACPILVCLQATPTSVRRHAGSQEVSWVSLLALQLPVIAVSAEQLYSVSRTKNSQNDQIFLLRRTPSCNVSFRIVLIIHIYFSCVNSLFTISPPDNTSLARV